MSLGISKTGEVFFDLLDDKGLKIKSLLADQKH
jgi:hypothetical protein